MAHEKWQETELGSFVSLQRGHDLPDHQRKSGAIPILGSFGITGYHDKAKAKGPGVTVGRSGASFGTVSFSRIDYWPLNTALFVTNFHGNDERFAYYALRSIDFKRYNSGSAQPSLNRNYIRSLRIKVPPKAEQLAIANILGSLDDKIELNRQTNETLEAIARIQFRSWFVDFDPVRAKAEARQPFGMNVETAALFPDSFGDSPVGKIPQGWRVQELGNIADVNWGDTNVTKRSYIQTGFRAFSASGPDGFLPYFDYDRVGVVVSAIGAESGQSWLAVGKWSCIKNTIRFWATAPDISTEYLFQVTWGKHQWPLRGSAQPFISQGDARRMKVIVPASGLGTIYGNAVAPLHRRMHANNEESSTLASIRDALLPKLISGEIRIKDAEQIIGAKL